MLTTFLDSDTNAAVTLYTELTFTPASWIERDFSHAGMPKRLNSTPLYAHNAQIGRPPRLSFSAYLDEYSGAETTLNNSALLPLSFSQRLVRRTFALRYHFWWPHRTDMVARASVAIRV